LKSPIGKKKKKIGRRRTFYRERNFLAKRRFLPRGNLKKFGDLKRRKLCGKESGGKKGKIPKKINFQGNTQPQVQRFF